VRRSLIFKTYVFFINIIIILLKTYVTHMSKAFVPFVVKKSPTDFTDSHRFIIKLKENLRFSN
ncbi:MAG: hypothetical protein J6O88_14890, partial [Chryseobacterium sp.]|uniref:hypothetical protein n=1 Tax=Chryseobacterium sp. TaxID=1871047 RepID=UPI001B06946A